VRAEEGLVVMRAFEEYWAGQPPVEEITWRAEPDATRRVEALLAGEVDLVADVTPQGARNIEASGQAEVFTSQSSVCAIFMCNLLAGVCTDQRVRQALNYALDMPELVETVMEGAARPLNGPLTHLHFGCDPATPPYPHDPEKARSLLAEAGYADGLQLVLDVPTRLPDEAPRLARRMAEQYAKVGIATQIKEFADRPGYADKVRAKQMDDACCFDSSPLSSYRVLREKFHSGVRGPWWQGYVNPEVDALIDQAQATADSVQRQEVYHRAYRMIRDDAPWIFLYSPIYSWGVGPRVRGWSAGNDGLIKLT
jgi:peptide/nickel transport system substrate-binding protein